MRLTMRRSSRARADRPWERSPSVSLPLLSWRRRAFKRTTRSTPTRSLSSTKRDYPNWCASRTRWRKHDDRTWISSWWRRAPTRRCAESWTCRRSLRLPDRPPQGRADPATNALRGALGAHARVASRAPSALALTIGPVRCCHACSGSEASRHDVSCPDRHLESDHLEVDERRMEVWTSSNPSTIHRPDAARSDRPRERRVSAQTRLSRRVEFLAGLVDRPQKSEHRFLVKTNAVVRRSARRPIERVERRHERRIAGSD